jgi:hypothetical protein
MINSVKQEFAGLMTYRTNYWRDASYINNYSYYNNYLNNQAAYTAKLNNAIFKEFDFVEIVGQFPLINEPNPSVESIQKAWKESTATDDYLIQSSPNFLLSGIANDISTISYDSLYSLNKCTNTTSGAGTINDALTESMTSAVNGGMPYFVTKFNLIRIYEYYKGIVPGSDMDSKIQWIKDNIDSISIDWNGYGVGPNGNKSFIDVYDLSVNDWHWKHNNGSGDQGLVSNLIDSSGMVYIITYNEPATDSIQSTIYMDYISIIIKLNDGTVLTSDLKDPAQPMRATTANRQKIFDEIKALSLAWGKDSSLKPIILSGINYANRDITLQNPENPNAGVQSDQAQENAYEAFTMFLKMNAG